MHYTDATGVTRMLRPVVSSFAFVIDTVDSRAILAAMQELPDTAKVFADIIGREATLKLAAVTKHRKLYVPNHLDDDHWIVRTIGSEAATRLHKTFRGELLPLATCHLIHVAERNDRIRADYINGAKVLAIMREHGMSLRAVRYVVAKVKGQRGRALTSNSMPEPNRKSGKSNRKKLLDAAPIPPG